MTRNSTCSLRCRIKPRPTSKSGRVQLAAIREWRAFWFQPPVGEKGDLRKRHILLRRSGEIKLHAGELVIPGGSTYSHPMTRQSDIAKHLGLSESSVSRILSGQFSHDDHTRAKVLALASELGCRHLRPTVRKITKKSR